LTGIKADGWFQAIQRTRIIRLIETVEGGASAFELEVTPLTLPVVALILPTNEDRGIRRHRSNQVDDPRYSADGCRQRTTPVVRKAS